MGPLQILQGTAPTLWNIRAQPAGPSDVAGKNVFPGKADFVSAWSKETRSSPPQ
jgi:hypothetical protein